MELREAGYTLPEIVKLTGRPKTSVYFHIYNIPLSNDRLQTIKLESGVRAKSIALTRKGKSRRNFKRFTQWNTRIVILLAHFMFDGTISRTGCIYNNRNKVLINRVEQCMKEIYDHEPKRWVNKITGVSRISYHNVALGTYLQAESIILLKDIQRLSKDMKREFVRSFFDDEGCIDFRPKRNLRQIRGYQKDISVLFLIQKLLADFGVESRVVKPNEVVISRKEYLIKFQEEVGFSPGVKLNENRSNSIWKRPLEKRFLLEQAISSFKT